jgi:predicted transcriptional regulator
MKEEVVRTGVDELLDLLGNNAKIPLTEVATKLKLDVSVIQAWVDFLVEEGIVGIEYKFTTPYIYMNKKVDKKSDNILEKEDSYNMQYFKKQFWDKAKANNIPDSQIEMLWKNHVIQALELQKKYFFFEAQRRKLTNVDQLWQEYKELIQYA